MLSGDGEAGSFGYVEGAPGSAKWKAPVAGVTGIDPVSGSMALFVVDTTSNRIRMVYLDGPAAGTSILIAGSGAAGYSEGEGDPFAARYNNPQGITAVKNDEGVVDALIIADTDNHLIRMLLAPLGGDRWRPEYLSGKEGSADYGDGPPNDTIFNTPVGITVGNDDNIYVADSLNGAIRRLDWSGNSSTFYISGVFTPKGVTPSGSHWLYVTSHSGHWINRVTAGTREVMSGSFPGFSDGPGLGSKYNNPFHLVWADTGGDGSLFIADTNNTRIRQYDLAGMLVSTYAGTADAGYKNDVSTSALFNGPKGIAIGPSNEIYIVEVSNNGIRTVKEE
jgi:hypothetical protein